MLHPNVAHRFVALVGAAGLVACSDQSPVAPSGATNGIQDVSTLAMSVEGAYDIDLFVDHGELILRAHVYAGSGDAQGGRVTFQVCSRKGGPTLQMAPLPSHECESGGPGTWVNLGSMAMGSCPGLGPGYACLDFGVAPATATVGFRFRYISQGSGIANGLSGPVDFVP